MQNQVETERLHSKLTYSNLDYFQILSWMNGLIAHILAANQFIKVRIQSLIHSLRDICSVIYSTVSLGWGDWCFCFIALHHSFTIPEIHFLRGHSNPLTLPHLPPQDFRSLALQPLHTIVSPSSEVSMIQTHSAHQNRGSQHTILLPSWAPLQPQSFSRAAAHRASPWSPSAKLKN